MLNFYFKIINSLVCVKQDADIVWLQDPFPHFYPDADFQIACDNFKGNPSDLHNSPNGGFIHVKTNNKTIEFYKFWYSSRLTYPGLNEQDVLNKIKFNPRVTEIGVAIKFLDTKYFGGFCQHGEDFNLVSTMHANCCFGLQSKIQDLNLVLEDWRRFMRLAPDKKAQNQISWSVPKNCRYLFILFLQLSTLDIYILIFTCKIT